MLLLLFVCFPACLCFPSTVPMVHISTLESSSQVRSSLSQLGALAITGLGHQYSAAIEQLELVDQSCLQVGAYVSKLSDGSYRSTLATSSEDPIEFPTCVSGAAATITKTFDDVDSKLSGVFAAIVGNDGWEDKTTGASGAIDSLPSKTHLHIYQAGNTSDEHSLSWPWHLDNGLYLLVTPSSELPLMLQSQDGGVLSSEGLPKDSMLLLAGRGLSEWMLQGTEGAVRAVPHAVPSLSPHGVERRTVVARMKVAPHSAIPTTPGASLTFGSVFSSLLPPRDTLTPSKAHLDWVKNHEGMCDAGYTYCWMGCQQVPQGCGDSSLAVCTTPCGAQCCTDTITQNCASHCGEAKCPTFKCPADGLHPDPSSSCTDRFYNCAWGVAHAEFCDPGLVFNPYVLMCDWPDSPAMAGKCCWTQ